MPSTSILDERLLSRKEAARYLGFSPETLAVWDCTGRYQLNPIKIGRTVRYKRSDLNKFAFSQTSKTNNQGACKNPRCDVGRSSQ